MDSREKTTMSNAWDETAMVVGDESTVIERETARSIAIPKAPTTDSTLAVMIQCAQGIVRDQKRLIHEAKQIGGLMAGEAFYRFPTGGAQVQGASIGLAEALAQPWKAIAYSVHVESVEHLATGGRRVHLRARVTDFHSLVMSEVDQVVTTSAPPGKFAAKDDQAERWHSMQTQSATSKIVRNVILRVIPDWFVEAALQAAYAQDAQNATAGKSLDRRAHEEGYDEGRTGEVRVVPRRPVGRPAARDARRTQPRSRARHGVHRTGARELHCDGPGRERQDEPRTQEEGDGDREGTRRIMTRETDAVIFTRRDTWRKAIAAARNVTGFTMAMAEAYAVDMVVDEIVRAARADGVTFDETSP
jgi:hypothetical protein